MKNIANLKWLLLLALGWFAVSCTSPKDILYFQDIDQTEMKKIEEQYEPVIMKDDKLQILISGPDKSIISPYNFTLSDNTSSGYTTSQSVVPYLVDSDGCIDMPGLGRMKVEGMRRVDLVKKITDMLRDGGLIKDPVVSVSFMNYKVTVLGEVRNPGTYVMDGERNTILQALGKAGDLLLTAKRDDIILIRDVDGKQTHIKIDLTKSDILNSPYFYMHQNDVIYVPQSATRVMQGTAATSLWSTVLSSITTLVTVITLIIRFKS